jgi:NAD(P)-dependent dehydrogenase (short-subunit alcohol dehydrogenase family)
VFICVYPWQIFLRITMDLCGNTFLVSGGSSGLGAACVRRFAAAGANVVIADINQAAGQLLTAELGGRTRFFATDVTNDDNVRQAIEFAVSTFGRLNGSVQCAGIAVAEKVLGKDGPNPLATFLKTIQINLIGTYSVMRWAAAAMSDNPPGADGERGILINTASVSAYEGQIGQAAYAACSRGVASVSCRSLPAFLIRR